ncbi:MAG: hypothetical protein FWG13_03110 [Leptospirales bacterium]|nr:hypothetical protein [Leptospirales bacterium]
MPKPSSAPVFCSEGGDTVSLTDVLSAIMREITVFSPQFSHIDMDRVLVSVAFNRFPSRGHICGKLVPLRFESGQEIMFHKGRSFRIPGLLYKDIEQLYVIYFYAPQFFDMPPHEKLKVIFHELYHINPEFNGDIRRMGKKKIAHGHSRKNFDSFFEEEAGRFGEHIANTEEFKFLSFPMDDFHKKFKKVMCFKIKEPRAVLVKDNDKT